MRIKMEDFMISYIKLSALALVSAGAIGFGVAEASADSANVGDTVQIAGNAWAEQNGFTLQGRRNWVGYVMSKKAIPHQSNSDYEYYIRYGNGWHSDHVLEQDLRNMPLTDAKYQVGQKVRVSNGAWYETNGWNIQNRRNSVGTVVSRRAIPSQSYSRFEYRVRFDNGGTNDHIMEQDLLAESDTKSAFEPGQKVQVNGNAWAESNGYNLVGRRNWVGNIVSKTKIPKMSNSEYEYYVRWGNGWHSDHILEQDLHKYVSNPVDLSGSIRRSVDWTTPNVDIAVYDIMDDRTTTYQKGELELNYTASIVKLSILVQLLHNQPNLSDDQKRTAENMIRNSDNDSATKLFGQIGNDNGIATLYRNLGMWQSSASGTNRWGLTTTTAADQLKLMKLVYVNGDYISQSNKDYIKSLMGSVNPNQRWGLPSYAGSSALGVKNGWLPLGPNNTDAIINSLSYVKNEKAEYILVQISNEDRSQNDGFNMLNRVGDATYNSFMASH